jgi:Fur family ferric uptake transcriptional regulator
MIQASQLLRTHQLRHTESRIEILGLFFSHKCALSQPEIEKAIDSCDRVTIYRTLSTFLEKGILHKVLDDAGSMKYALCPASCQTYHHNHEHVHFKCGECGDTTCLEDIQIPPVALPTGYALHAMNLLLQGTCPKCC